MTRYPDLYPAPEVQSKRKHSASHIAGEIILVAVTILLAAAVWKFVMGYMAWGASAPSATIQSVAVQNGILTATIQNIGAVPIRNASLVYLNGPLPHPVPLITSPVPPGSTAGAGIDIANLTRSAPPYTIMMRVIYANNVTQVLTATMG
ncbi:MAG: type IV pilin [Conexivisphaera sp.]